MSLAWLPALVQEAASRSSRRKLQILAISSSAV
jgi:hypothetical protein